jgi:hypothetical protein
MHKLLLLAAFASLALTGCQDNSETDALKSQLAHTRQDLIDAREESRAEKAALQERIERLEMRLGKTSTDANQPTLREEIDALKIKAALAKHEGASDPELEKRIAAMEEKVNKVESKVDTTNAEVSKVKEETAATKKEVADAKNATTQTKDFNQAIARLDISEGDKQAIKDEIVKSKKELLELLEVPTADGRHFGEELIDTFIKAQMSGENKQAEIMGIFADLSNTKVPGDTQGRSYVEMINEIKKRNRDSIGRILKPEDQKKLDAAHADWTDFEGIEGDPFGELYMARLKKYQEENKK